jgi:hypothetical protein
MFEIEWAGIGYWWILPLGLFVVCFLVCAFWCRGMMRQGRLSCCPPGCCGRESTRRDDGEGSPEPEASRPHV